MTGAGIGAGDTVALTVTRDRAERPRVAIGERRQAREGKATRSLVAAQGSCFAMIDVDLQTSEVEIAGSTFRAPRGCRCHPKMLTYLAVRGAHIVRALTHPTNDVPRRGQKRTAVISVRNCREGRGHRENRRYGQREPSLRGLLPANDDAHVLSLVVTSPRRTAVTHMMNDLRSTRDPLRNFPPVPASSPIRSATSWGTFTGWSECSTTTTSTNSHPVGRSQAHTTKEQKTSRRAHMTVRGDDLPTRERWRVVPIPVLTGVLAVIGAVVLAVFLSGCQGLFGGQGPTASSRAAAPSASSRAATPSTGPTHRVTATVPVGRDPMGVAVDPGTHTVDVPKLGDRAGSVMDASTRTVTATVPVARNPMGVAVDPGTHTVYVANLGDNSVSVIDGATRTVTATVPVGKSPWWGVAVDPGTHTVYVPNLDGDTVSVIDASTRTVTATVPVARNPVGVAVDPGTHTVYVPTNDGTVSVIDASTRTVTATVPVGKGPHGVAPVGRGPGGVAVDAGTHTVYVTNNGDSVSVIDASTRTVTATLPVGKSPGGVAVDPGTHTVYVANYGDNSVSVIDASTRTVTATVAIGGGPRGVAVDPGTHTVYVTITSVSGNGTVSAIESR